eukprot:Plantae.Rhodophyta-Palmaria_palmata.ctg23843.p1 GENE.Plantae.Rhodophyta-Palmaria_palmata.ctg23843~~Plantae.Rhodophyta-Palmaria_palmata.ctg23843.p1  ORF type:complete len:215 (-),score=11.60 Plantae.Rhodophyta-Palmaria_palmata.ctg23843:41-634(-)
MVYVIPAWSALNYAFDQGSEPSTWASLDGRTFAKMSADNASVAMGPIARLVETPMLFCFGWVLLGATAFFPWEGATIQRSLGCTLPCLIGVLYAFKINPAYWAADTSDYKRWNYVFYGLMAGFATTVGVQGGDELILAMLGVVLILVGRHVDMLERRRGTWWLKERAINPNPTAYGYGQPVYLVGWILLSLAVAVPM